MDSDVRIHVPRSHEVNAAIAELAASQQGVLHVSQFEALGLSRRAAAHRVRAGHLYRVHRGVYAMSPLLTWEGRCRAALLAAGPRAVLSGAAAVRLWRMARIEDSRIELLVPGHARRVDGVRIARTDSLPATEWTEYRGFRVATPSRAIVEYSIRADAYDTIGVLHEAGFRCRLDVAELVEVNARLQTRAGTRKLSSRSMPAKRGVPACTVVRSGT